MQAIAPPIALPTDRLIPSPDLFTHRSTLHGQAHVARVMVHAFRLIEAIGWTEEAPRLWAAVYLHDIARTHDGRCFVHGERAMEKIETLPHLFDLFATGGVEEQDYAAIRTAVIYHCKPQELDRGHEHWRLASLLKDADGLDRVRLGDLDPAYLRHPQAQTMIGFAERLFEETDGVFAPGADYFARLWPEALRLAHPPIRTAT
jgi:hypothetical protein